MGDIWGIIGGGGGGGGVALLTTGYGEHPLCETLAVCQLKICKQR